ncbi:hypothetical protein BGY98DRAFT_942242 [Russula aff. rugulosa BPL654]|nr:hypothetical protein BGY98DRAFT_942242 [Russula aff. rugulosa BPL654]
MPPPPPLSNAPNTSARIQHEPLTPRTPHSRSGRAEEAFTEIELPSSGYRARGDDDPDVQKKSRGPLVVMQWLVSRCGLVFGSALALVLFLTIILSYKNPDYLRSVSGIAGSSPSPIPIPTPQQDDNTLLHPENIISYENYTHFPLDPLEYKHECHKLVGEFMPPMRFWSGEEDVVHHDKVDPGKYPAPEGLPTQICHKTITYMLDGHVGLLADLALMAQAAGLARETNKTFFVDDTYWNRGKWADHFQDVRARQPGPDPGCRAPPPEELVINSRTAKYHFGHAFQDEFEDPYGHELNRVRGIYNRSRESLTETVRPNAATAALIRSARIELASFLGLDSDDSRTDQYQSIYVRRGDGLGSSWKYHDKHVPIEEYSIAGNAAWNRLFRSEGNTAPPAVYLASDDPDVFEELQSQLEPGSMIFSLSRSQNPDLQNIASPAPYFQDKFAELPEADRVQLTKGMIVDFALLSGLWAWHDDLKPGAVVCGTNSNVCRMAAVALDWDRAFGYGFRDDYLGEVNQEHARWIDVDEKGAISPSWKAFQMF